jgi:deazaflavin-dependent oxidoreductase (nitroreductase family)
MYSRIVNAFSATAAGSWIVKYIASEIDPLLFRATNGRITSTGIATLPMLCMTVVGRKSGKPRHVQLAYYKDGGSWLVVASAMGQERHPGWRYNLEANPEVELQMRGERFAARANLLDDTQKERIWPSIKETIPQMNVYENRTDRNIRVFRLTRIG